MNYENEADKLGTNICQMVIAERYPTRVADKLMLMERYIIRKNMTDDGHTKTQIELAIASLDLAYQAAQNRYYCFHTRQPIAGDYCTDCNRMDCAVTGRELIDQI